MSDSALDQDYITDAEFSELFGLSIEVSKTLWGLIKSLKTKAGWVVGSKIALLCLAAKIGLTKL